MTIEYISIYVTIVAAVIPLFIYLVKRNKIKKELKFLILDDFTDVIYKQLLNKPLKLEFSNESLIDTSDNKYIESYIKHQIVNQFSKQSILLVDEINGSNKKLVVSYSVFYYEIFNAITLFLIRDSFEYEIMINATLYDDDNKPIVLVNSRSKPHLFNLDPFKNSIRKLARKFYYINKYFIK